MLRLGVRIPQHERDLARRRDVHLAADLAHLEDVFLDGRHLAFCLGVARVVAGRGIRREHHAVGIQPRAPHVAGGDQRLRHRAHALPDLFRDERHHGMQRAQQRFEHHDQRAARAALLRLRAGLGLQHRLGELEIPVAELVPGEFVQRRGGEVEAIVVERRVHLRQRVSEARDDPAVGHGEFGFTDQAAARGRRRSGRITLQRHEHEARRVPDLVAEVAVAVDAAEIEVDVACRSGERGEGEAQRIGAVGRHAFGKLLARGLLDLLLEMRLHHSAGALGHE